MRSHSRARRITWLATAPLIILSAAQARAEDHKEQVFALPAQSLDASLQAIGRQSGREIMYPKEVVDRRVARPVTGRMTADDAIRVLLRGTGLIAEFQPNVVLIRGTAGATEVDNDPAPAAEVVVTGTRLRTAPIARVQSVSRDAARAQGFTDVGALARSLPENFTGGQNPGVVSSDQKGAEDVNGSTALNLRGLGPDATLTLINGHRVAYDGANQGVDISAVPLIAIDRLDVLPDGSSALYGSDAVAGVANVVLRRDYDGVLTTGRVATPTDGGGFQQQASILVGHRWSDGGAMAAFDYSHAAAVNAGQRSLTRELEPSTTLIPGQRQFSGVAAAHQQLGASAELSIDAQALSRSSGFTLPFETDADARSNGNIVGRLLQSYSVAPTLTLDLGKWRGRLSGAHGISTTTARVGVFFDGSQVVRATTVYRDSLDTAEVGAEGPVFPLPGGSARLAIGAGWRGLGLRGSAAGTYFGTERTVLDVRDHRDVTFAYGEASLPLVGPDTDVPGVALLRVDGALRYEHYSGIGGIATPRAAIRYDPVSGVSLRASWGRSFKAPTLFQSKQAPNGALVPADYFSPTPETTAPVLLLAGGGRPLTPERARTVTAGVVLKPFGDRDISLEATYYNLHYRNRVSSPIIDDQTVFGTTIYDDLITHPGAAEVDAIVATLPAGLSNQTDTPYDPANVFAVVDERLQNIAAQTVSGIDIGVHASTDVAPEQTILLDATVTYLESDQRLSPNQPVVTRAGTIFDPPNWRGRAAAGWRTPSISIIGGLSYIGGTRDDRFAPTTRVGSFTSFDLTATISPKIARGPLAGSQLIVSATNLFAATPARIRTTSDIGTPFDSTNYPIVGRVLSFGLEKKW